MLQKRVIMHIDDDARVAGIVSKFLTRAGYRVMTVHSADDGLRKISVYRPDLIVLDLNMPGMNGLSFLRRIATPEGKTRVPVVVFTAFSDMQDETATQLAAGVLTKPNDLDKLPEMIEKVLSAAAPEGPQPEVLPPAPETPRPEQPPGDVTG